MSVNSAGNRPQPQLSMLLQGTGSKLPPINELLKTSVGLLRPVNLAPNNGSNGSGSGNFASSSSANNVSSSGSNAVPQQLFRYPYGMPLQPPLVLNQRTTTYPQPFQSQATSSQNNAVSRDVPSRVIVVQEHPNSTSSVVFVQGGSVNGEKMSPISKSHNQMNEQLLLPFSPNGAKVEDKLGKKPRRKRGPKVQNGDCVTTKAGKRSATPSSKSSSPDAASCVPKQKRPRKAKIESVEGMKESIENELQIVRERLLIETGARDLERVKNEATIVSLKEDIVQLKKRIEAADSLVSTLEKKNAYLSNELMVMNGSALSRELSQQLVCSLRNLVDSLAQHDLSAFDDVTSVANKVIAQLSNCPTFQQQHYLQVPTNNSNNNGKTFLGIAEESVGDDHFNVSLTSPDYEQEVETNSSSGGCGGFRLLCPHCLDYSTTVLRNLLAHFGRKHHCKWDNSPFNCKPRGTPARCPSCQDSAKDFLQLAVHFVREHFRPSNQFLCQFSGCVFASTQQWDLLQHVASTHLKVTEPFLLLLQQPVVVEKQQPQVDSLSVVSTSSSTTYSTFPQNGNNSNNNNGSSSNLLCICKHCPYRTERYTDMRKHALRRHGDETAFERREATETDPEITYACGVCPSRFFRPGDLKRHRSRYGHFEGTMIKQEPDDSNNSTNFAHPQCNYRRTTFRFLAPKLNLAARVHAKLTRRFFLLNRRKRLPSSPNFEEEESPLQKNHQFVSSFPVDEVEDLFNKAPPSPDLALLISNSDIKTLCDFPGDVEKLLDD